MAGGPCCDEEAAPDKFSFAGKGQGGYVQESKYRYVGNDAGDFAKVGTKSKRRILTNCLGGVVAVAFVGWLACSVLRGAGQQPLVPAAGGPARFNCVPDGLEKGERVQAAADIAFQPSGFVRQHSLGTVVADEPGGHGADTTGGDQGSRVVTVSWDDIPGLSSSRVYRDMLMRAIELGDAVEAAADVMYEAPKGTPIVPPSLEIADLVRSTEDLGTVRKGTYGTVVATAPSAGLELGHVVVRFSNQLNTVKVSEVRVARAPQVGDRVRAILPIVPEAGAEPVPGGTIGRVVAVTPAESGYVYRFTVDWAGHSRTGAWEAELGPLQGSEGLVVPKGAAGRVKQLLPLPQGAPGSEQRFVVEWASFPGPGALIDRGRLKKTVTWTAQEAAFCNAAATGSLAGGATARDQVLTVHPQVYNHENVVYDCEPASPASWDVLQATWCCDNAKIGCAPASEQGGPGAAPVQPLPVPVNFDPAPRAVAPTLEPSVLQVN